jgi:iron complex transport system ATP-binding protein
MGGQRLESQPLIGVDHVVGDVGFDDLVGGHLGAHRAVDQGVEMTCQTDGGQVHRNTVRHACKFSVMAAVIDLAEVSIVRGGATLLDKVSWTVDESERWVIIGPNGAGKTTLLQVVSAQIHPTSGVAGLLGEVLGTVDVFELRPRIGLTSASLAERIPRSERVHDVVVSAGYAVIGRWRESYDDLDHQRADQLLTQLGIQSLIDRTFGTLSEGEKKRVQIARALMTDPELLLLDEPAAGLDLAGREGLVRTLSELTTDPYAPATVLVTHHVEEIPAGITHAMLLKRGSVVAAGPVAETLTADTLSETFDLRLELAEDRGRFAARAVQ